MGYTPTEWAAGDVVTAAKLNKLENGLADGVWGVETASTDMADKLQAMVTAGITDVISRGVSSSVQTNNLSADDIAQICSICAEWPNKQTLVNFLGSYCTPIVVTPFVSGGVQHYALHTCIPYYTQIMGSVTYYFRFTACLNTQGLAQLMVEKTAQVGGSNDSNEPGATK